MKEQRSLLSSSAMHISCNHSLSKSVCRALSNRADVRIFKEHLPLHEGEGWAHGERRAGR